MQRTFRKHSCRGCEIYFSLHTCFGEAPTPVQLIPTVPLSKGFSPEKPVSSKGFSPEKPVSSKGFSPEKPVIR